MCQTNTKTISEEQHAPDKEVWSFLASAMDKKRTAKRKRPDMCREALLQLTVQRLNDEIAERCMKKTKKQRVEEEYLWKYDDANGWCMPNGSYQDDDEWDALLGINSFFSELSKIRPRRKTENDVKDKTSTVLPSFRETFGRITRSRSLSDINEGPST